MELYLLPTSEHIYHCRLWPSSRLQCCFPQHSPCAGTVQTWLS